ncbi:MAG TPA: GTPase ObgE [Chloroflexota bacterium]|nr:GTPase ObgE [Chloroflexota bacterium]
MFYDQARITVLAGNGGNGAMHMRREKYVPRGGPDGGDGGRGGSVYVEADPGLNTLLPFRYKRQFKAQHGGAGGEKKQHGRAGEDLVILVPPGTVVRDGATGETVADVVEPGRRLLVARGGKGGLGNVHFATSTRQTPEFAQKGEPGEERELELELRLIADVGLVGFPNAGKSSLLAAISAARPKIADYPFTTLEPNLGVVGVGEETSFVVADIPGLIEGASTGAGLGHQFLRHVSRTRLLVHVLDAAQPEPLHDFKKINAELGEYAAELADRPQIVAANKMDLPDASAQWPQLRGELQKLGVPAVPISAATRQGLDELVRLVAAKLAALRQEELERAAAEQPRDFEVADDHRVYTPLQQSREFYVERAPDGVLEVTGRAAERAIQMTDLENEAALKYLQGRLRQIGVTAALEKAGVKPGDAVRIGDVELEWMAPAKPPEQKRRTARQRKVGS